MEGAKSQNCAVCGVTFESRNKLFKHVSSSPSCAVPAAASSSAGPSSSVVLSCRKWKQRWAVLYGYSVKANSHNHPSDHPGNLAASSAQTAVLLGLKVVFPHLFQDGGLIGIDESALLQLAPPPSTPAPEDAPPAPRFVPLNVNRSYGNTTRSGNRGALSDKLSRQDDCPPSAFVKTDSGYVVMSELLLMKCPCEIEMSEDQIEALVAVANDVIKTSSSGDCRPFPFPSDFLLSLEVFGIVTHGIPADFNAESSVTQRRVEYIMPLEMLLPRVGVTPKPPVTFPTVSDLTRILPSLKTRSLSSTPLTVSQEWSDLSDLEGDSSEILRFYAHLKSAGKMFKPQRLAPLSAASVAKKKKKKRKNLKREEERRKKRSETAGGKEERRPKAKTGDDLDQVVDESGSPKLGAGESEDESDDDSTDDEEDENDYDSGENDSTEDAQQQRSETVAPQLDNVGKCEAGGEVAASRQQQGGRMKRRRHFHNLSTCGLPQDVFTSIRLDRFHHSTSFQYLGEDAQSAPIPFIGFTISASSFVHGMVTRSISLYLAIALGLVPANAGDVLFDADFPFLLMVPDAPHFAMNMLDAAYSNSEQRVGNTLRARMAGERASQVGSWVDGSKVSERVLRSRDEGYKRIAEAWISGGRDAGAGSLLTCSRFVIEVLVPWASGARRHFEMYEAWVGGGRDVAVLAAGVALRPPPKDYGVVPALFQECLTCLREVDGSGKWPATTANRAAVIVVRGRTFDAGMQEKEKLKAKKEKGKGAAPQATEGGVRLSIAPASSSGSGGSSGSFSVGHMPGVGSSQPRGNVLFPSLVSAAFELERRLMPGRLGSATIAINRNAEFRPHTDSGAGSGQTTSLIVGMGDYVGGECVVEGVEHDIRYKPVEFDGWKERHWTKPFCGERYTLVWFTPNGCEGMNGWNLPEAVKGSQLAGATAD